MINLVRLLNHTQARMQAKIINSMIEESKYCSDAIKKHFNKEFVMFKKDNENFETLINVGSVIMLIMMLK